jgi:hypothetical protein
MKINPSDVVKYMNNESKTKLFNKLRRSLIFSVLSTIMQTLNGVYHQTDIIIVALTINIICTIIHGVILGDSVTRRRFHCGYILRSISRQCLLVIADAIANAVHMRDVGTQSENTLLLVVTTTAYVGILTLIPGWFLADSVQGSLKDILLYSFTSRYRQLQIPGLRGSTGLGTMVYGILFIIVNIFDNPSDSIKHPRSPFFTALMRAASMVFSNQFLSRIVPVSTRQIFPVAILLGTYILSDHLPMSGSVAAFVLWQTAQEISTWTMRVFPGGTADQIMLFSLLMCVLPVINSKTGAVIAVSALQTLVSSIMSSFKYLGTTGAVISSICMLLATDIALDAPE